MATASFAPAANYNTTIMQTGLIAVVISLLFLITGVISAIFLILRQNDGTWKLTDALSEEVAMTDSAGKSVIVMKASTSRVIALFGMILIFSLYAGLGLIVLWSVSNTGQTPKELSEATKFISIGASLFAPYLVNQVRSAFDSRKSLWQPNSLDPPEIKWRNSEGFFKLAVVNINLSKPIEELKLVVRAIEKQVNNEFKSAWKVGANIETHEAILKNGRYVDEKTFDRSKFDAVIYVGQSSQDEDTGADAFGTHEVRNGAVCGFVYIDVCDLKKEPWSATLSHEILEILIDPTGNFYEIGPDPYGSGINAKFAKEVCDPTQHDFYSVDGVLLCNFVTPNYFDTSCGDLRSTNKLGLVLPPFKARAGGYAQFSLPGQSSERYWGPASDATMDEAKLAAAVMKSLRRNQRRSDRYHNT